MKSISKILDPKCEIHAAHRLSKYEFERSSRIQREELHHHVIANMAHSMARELERRMTVTIEELPRDYSVEMRAKVYVFSEGELVDFYNRARTEFQTELLAKENNRRF